MRVRKIPQQKEVHLNKLEEQEIVSDSILEDYILINQGLYDRED